MNALYLLDIFKQLPVFCDAAMAGLSSYDSSKYILLVSFSSKLACLDKYWLNLLGLFMGIFLVLK